MKKIKTALATALAMFLLPVSLAFGVTNSPSTITGSGSSSTSGITVTVSGTRQSSSSAFTIESSSTAASNVPSGQTAVVSFAVTTTEVGGPYSYTFSLGSSNANHYVTVYVQKADGSVTTVTGRTDANGDLVIETDALADGTSIFSVVMGDEITTTTDTSSTSPQTGIDTTTAAVVTGAAVVAAAGVAFTLRKKVSE